MPKIYDLKKKSNEDIDGKVKNESNTGIKFVVSNEDIPELEDYSIGEDVELRVKAKVVKITKPELKDNEQKLTEPSNITLEIIEAEIMNMKEDRMKAENMGLDIKDYRDIQGKRKGERMMSA